MTKKTAKQIIIDTNDPNHIVLSLAGRLDNNSIPNLWQECFNLISQYKPDTLVIDAKEVTYCDGSGIALLTTLKNQQEKTDKKFNLLHLNPQFQPLFEIANKKAVNNTQIPTDETLFAENVGHLTVSLWKHIYNNIVFLGQLCCLLAHSLLHPHTLRWKNICFALEDVGPKAFPIIALIGFLIGLISTFQSAGPLGDYGAQIYVINLVALGLVREMGPLMTAVLLAARTASSFAAEIGTMKINQEIDALQTMGINPVQFLTIPRVIATTLMAPLLSIFFILFGLIGCSIVMYSLGYPPQTFLNQLHKAISLTAILGGLIKITVFGLVIASIGCLYGLRTKMNASAVGDSTTQAVVSSLIMIVCVDGIFATIYYTLGI